MGVIRGIRKIGVRLLKDESGIAYVEFGLSLPFLMLFFMGTVEVSRYLLLSQKLEKVVNTVGDVVAQSSEAKTSDMDKLFSATDGIMQPFTFGSDGVVIVTSITRTNGTATVSWQYTGGGTLSHTSALGTTGQVATLPSGFTMFDGENVLFTELYYNFTPMLNQQILGNQQLYKLATFRPRLGALASLTDDN